MSKETISVVTTKTLQLTEDEIIELIKDHCGFIGGEIEVTFNVTSYKEVEGCTITQTTRTEADINS